jgi:hypothetical protein
LGENAGNGRTLGCAATSKAVGRKKRWVEKGASMNIGEPADHQKDPPLAGEKVGASHDQNNQNNNNEDEARRIRRLQVMMSMVMSVIGQDPSLTLEEASELAAGAKRAALAMFPDKELAYDLLYKPRLQRLMRERFRIQ